MKLLFLGRFQPFHNGHLAMMKELSAKYDKIVVAIGSADKSNTMLNPFTSQERKEMIELGLNGSGISYEIIAVPDIPEDSEYVYHVQSFTLFDAVFTGNDHVRELFLQRKMDVIPFFENAERYGGISSTRIRQLMKEGKEWKQLVPENVAEYIEKIDGVKLMQSL